MTTACLCEVERPGLATVLATRGIGVQRTGRGAIAGLRPPVGSVLLLALPAGDRALGSIQAAWRGPLMLLLAGGGQHEITAALDAGADDAVTDRAGDSLVAARIAALARRRPAGPTIAIGSLSIDPVARSVSRAGRVITLLPREYAVLLHLARAGGRTVSRADLRENVWGLGFDPGTNVIEVHISRLRGKLDRGFGAPLLLTERGRGYRLAVE